MGEATPKESDSLIGRGVSVKCGYRFCHRYEALRMGGDPLKLPPFAINGYWLVRDAGGSIVSASFD